MRIFRLMIAKCRVRAYRDSLSQVLITLLFVSSAIAVSGQAGSPAWNIIKPSTTGVPGDEVRVMTFDPSGNLWVASRFYFWQEWGLAMLPADQLDHRPLPGGGYDTGAWKVWSTGNGHPLPSQYMYDIEFGADGILWIASEGGLTRFDPNAATPDEMWFTYNPANSPLILNDVRSLDQDSQGNIWLTNVSVLYSFGALFKYNPASNQWTKYEVGQQLPWSLPWSNINEVVVGANDHIWLTHSALGGMAEFNGTTWVLHDSPYQMDGMLPDDQGNVWATSGGHGLFKWNGSSWQHWPQMGGTITTTGVGEDRDGTVYVSSWYGDIYKMINDEPVFFVNAGNIPGSVIGRPNGDIWINNYGGNGELGKVRHYTSAGQLLSGFQHFNTGLPDYIVDRIVSDSYGNMWFATGEGGLSRMQGSNGSPDVAHHWRNWGAHNYGAEPYPFAPSEPIYDVLEDTGGIFWMAGNGVGRWNSATGQFTNFWNVQNSNLDSSGMRVLAKRQGIMWVGTGGSGVSWLGGNQWTRVLLSPDNYDANHVNAMTVDTDYNLWVGSNYGLRKFIPGNNTTFTTYYQSNSPLPSDYILDLIPDPNGGIWIATAAGLVRFNGTTWTTYNQANTGMPGTTVSSVARRASDGLIAIGSYQGFTAPYTGGVSTFDGKSWTHYTPNNSPLLHWQVADVEFDLNGNLWASPLSTGVVQIMIGNRSQDAPFDFDGDGKTDISIFRPSVAEWWYARSSDGQVRAGQFGSPADLITPGDFSGDGKTDLAFFRPATGEWFVLRSENGTYYSVPFGTNGDIPMPADYDADGKTDVTVFRPNTGLWYIARSSDAQVSIVQFGAAGDQPVAADYDGDGQADLAIVRDNAGNREWWIQRSTAGIFATVFGQTGDKAVPGDYTGDGKADLAVWRPANGNWFVLRSENYSYFSFPFGQTGDVPAAGDYDGDGKFDAALFRPFVATWFINRSTSGVLITTFGSQSDVPVPGGFVR